jgi:nucleoside 2-deoxyribosyltransferase
MLAMIASARLIVVDLSLERPNVYFELGYARGLGKRVITILREGSTAHLDVQDWQYLVYVDSRPLEKDLADRFQYELQRGEQDD